MSKRRFHRILARRGRAIRIEPRPPYAIFPIGRWDIRGERRTS